MKKFLFYFLSLTWGLPLTLIGIIVALVMIITCHKPKQYGWCWYFEVGENWGGVEFGIFFVVNQNPSDYIRNHELGHGLQNCLFGPLMPLIVCIPSAIRYWIRVIKSKHHRQLVPYDSIWFENDATTRGTKFMKNFNKEN